MAAGAPIVVCVSANPALDRRLHVPSLTLGEVNRARTAVTMPGGKSAHVAMAAKALGARAAWIGFSGGAAGDQNEAGLAQLGIEVRPVRTDSETRMNLEAIEESGRITEVLEPGGLVDENEQREMLDALARWLRENWQGAAVTVSGSLPPGIAPNFYASVIRLARDAGSRVFLDTSGDALRESLAAGPDFVKPNRREAEQLVGAPLNTIETTIKALDALIDRGAHSVAITLGADGLVWKPANGSPCWLAKPPNLKPISTVGCGDATLGGFAYAMQTGLREEETVRLAAACGTANCVAQLAGQINEADVKKFLPQIEVRRIDS
ncbi:MAG: 1-phosphofructokinase family hexose kinase [Candidatus Acidiferrales bacterium]